MPPCDTVLIGRSPRIIPKNVIVINKKIKELISSHFFVCDLLEHENPTVSDRFEVFKGDKRK